VALHCAAPLPADPLPYAAPVFLAALAVEGWLIRYSPRALVSGLGCIIVDQLTAAWGLALFVVGFAGRSSRGSRWVELSSSSIATWVIAVVGHDPRVLRVPPAHRTA